MPYRTVLGPDKDLLGVKFDPLAAVAMKRCHPQNLTVGFSTALQGYLDQKKMPPPPRTTIDP